MILKTYLMFTQLFVSRSNHYAPDHENHSLNLRRFHRYLRLGSFLPRPIPSFFQQHGTNFLAACSNR